MKKFIPHLLGFILVTTIILAIVGHISQSNYEFSGLIQKIKFEEPKHTPIITVHQINYKFVYRGTEFDSIKVGDSIIKLKGEESIRIIKK
ncbi:hypothetical protein MUGA111182_20040 [Mucilaginibacter galii]|uniref:Uncharacterized protein n=1 Tax=Mucilaginibacter galii TaxID=2005073 RepID=A0A917JFE4_9SPHI|nr:hypothetical protein [Mucilaginibacter galii]GGI52769.1 hypothetical protein GCM10011425_39810 [Mucilaginibacter galii]